MQCTTCEVCQKMAVCWWLVGSLFLFALRLETILAIEECLGAFEDFNSVEGNRVDVNAQYIIPELNFSCDGTVTQWKVGLESSGRGDSVNLQIWRSVGAGEYTSVTEVVYTKTVIIERIATVPVSMSVMAGDMVGFYVPDRQLELHTVPDVGLTMYTTEGAPTSSLSFLSSVVGPSPYISVVFAAGESSTPKSSSVDPSSQFPSSGGGGPSAQVSGATIGAVVAIVAVVLVVGSVIVAASLIAWRVSGNTSTGVSPPESSTAMTMQDDSSYSTVQEELVMQKNPAYEQTSGLPPPEASTAVTMQANPSYTAADELEPNPCYSTVQTSLSSAYEPISGEDRTLVN